MSHKIVFNSIQDVHPMLSQLGAQIMQVVGKEPVEISVQRSNKRSINQNSKFHAMITDIQNTAEIEGKFSFKAWKDKLIDEFVQELARNGEGLTSPGETVLSFDKKRMITIRPSSADFLKVEGAKFITFLYAFGHEIGAKFSDPAIKYYEEARQVLDEKVKTGTAGE